MKRCLACEQSHDDRPGLCPGMVPDQGLGREHHVGDLVHGRYRLLSRVGGGPTEPLYLSDDERTGGRVVVRMVFLHATSSADLEGACRHSNALVRRVPASHRNIAAIRDVGVLEPDGLFFVLDAAVGPDLARLLTVGGALPVKRALRFAVQIAEALQAAHDRGLTHGELRPELVFVDGRDGVQVAGWELAVMRAAVLSQRRAGMLASGLPASYAAPEMLDGEVSSRADVFSLGVIMHEMLWGVLPGGRASLRARRRDVPKSLDEFIERSLDRRPDHRPETISIVNALVSELWFATQRPEAGETRLSGLRAFVPVLRDVTSSQIRVAMLIATFTVAAVVGIWKVVPLLRSGEHRPVAIVREPLDVPPRGHTAPTPPPPAAALDRVKRSASDHKPQPASRSDRPPSTATAGSPAPRTRVNEGTAPEKRSGASDPTDPVSSRRSPAGGPDPGDIIDWLIREGR